MSKKPNSSPGPWEAVKDGDEYRLRVKGSVRKHPGFQLERPPVTREARGSSPLSSASYG